MQMEKTKAAGSLRVAASRLVRSVSHHCSHTCSFWCPLYRTEANIRALTISTRDFDEETATKPRQTRSAEDCQGGSRGGASRSSCQAQTRAREVAYQGAGDIEEARGCWDDCFGERKGPTRLGLTIFSLFYLLRAVFKDSSTDTDTHGVGMFGECAIDARLAPLYIYALIPVFVVSRYSTRYSSRSSAWVSHRG